MGLGWNRRSWKVFATVLHRSGALRMLSLPRSRRALIVAYHRVIPEESHDRSFVQPGMYVTDRTLDMHLGFLRAHYRLVPLDALATARESNACAITFDDGWRDNFTNALPVLRKHGAPATVFVATGLVGSGRWPWPDRISFYAHKAAPADFTSAFIAAWQAEVRETDWRFDRAVDSYDVVEQALRRLKHLEHHVLTAVVSRLDASFRDLDVALHRERPWLTWDEILEMSRQGVSFGAHTENHVILTSLPPHQARDEITRSRTVLSDTLGRPVASFCYPNGSYNLEIAKMVEEAGFHYAVTTRDGTVSPGSRPFELSRVMLHDDISSTPALLACTLAGSAGFRQLWRGFSRRSA